MSSLVITGELTTGHVEHDPLGLLDIATKVSHSSLLIELVSVNQRRRRQSRKVFGKAC